MTVVNDTVEVGGQLALRWEDNDLGSAVTLKELAQGDNSAHHARHESGGADEIDATGLTGIPDVSALVTLTGAEELTKKTLTTPVIASLYQDAGKTKLMTLPNVASDTLAVLGAAQTFTGKKTVGAIVQTVTALSPAGSGTSTCDLSLGNCFVLTMPANTQTLAISNATVGMFFKISINNVTSQGALTWFTTIRWVDGGTAPTLTGTNGKRDSFVFEVTGVGTYDGYIAGQNL